MSISIANLLGFRMIGYNRMKWSVFVLFARVQPCDGRMTGHHFKTWCKHYGQQYRGTSNYFHSSASLLRRKQPKPIVFPAKSKKKSDVTVQVWKNITVAQLAKTLQKDIDQVFEIMLYVDNSEQYDTPNAAIDNMTVISEVVRKFGIQSTWIANPMVELESKANKDVVRRLLPDPKFLVKRPPVVTIMGHVDHGKTTLLDSLRNTSVVSQEFGGITQHIGAFSVTLPSSEKITFLDTPGHAAFMAMRARGASVTDIIVLVVAADDGVMEQTVECIRLAKEVNVPVIVAINKIDKPQVDIEQCKKGLIQNGIQLEEYGGEIQSVPISALEGTNLDLLMETIVTQAEMMQLKSDRKGLVEGYVVESRTDVARGKLSTSVIKRGTLRKGAVLVAGTAWAKVRAMFDSQGQVMQEATPSTPVEIVGWRELPQAGDELLEVETEGKAHEVVEFRLELEKAQKLDEDRVVVRKKMEEHLKVYKEALQKRLAEGRYRARRTGVKAKEARDEYMGPELNVVLKGDVNGSVEAILDVLDTFHSPLCRLNVIHYGVGLVTENDIELCSNFKGIVYSFNIGALPNARNVSTKMGVPIKEFNVIYRLVDDIRSEIDQRLPLVDKDEILGEADVLQEFIINEGKFKIPVAGCRCSKGTLKKSWQFRLVRGEEVIHEGLLSSMRHLKSEVDSIKTGVECGLRLVDREVRFQLGDKLVCFQKIKVPQKSNWDPGF